MCVCVRVGYTRALQCVRVCVRDSGVILSALSRVRVSVYVCAHVLKRVCIPLCVQACTSMCVCRNQDRVRDSLFVPSSACACVCACATYCAC